MNAQNGITRRETLLSATTLGVSSAAGLPMALAPSAANAQPNSTLTFRPTNLKEQLLYQRAFEAVLWAMPAADTLVMRRAQREWGMKEGAVFYFENRPTGKTEVITFNNPLSEAGAPRPTEFIDATAKPFHGTPTFDLSYFDYIDATVQNEPVFEYDKVMMGCSPALAFKRGSHSSRTREPLPSSIAPCAMQGSTSSTRWRRWRRSVDRFGQIAAGEC